MSLETGTFISDLVASNPTSTDLKSQGDDHIRLVKKAIKASFPSIAGAVTVSEAVINSIPFKADISSPAFTDTPTAPTAAISTNTTQLATTAFVKSQVANDAPTKSGVNATGTWPVSVTGNAVTSNAVANAAGWSIFPSGNYLYFNFNGNNVAVLDSTGNFSAEADVTAFQPIA